MAPLRGVADAGAVGGRPVVGAVTREDVAQRHGLRVRIEIRHRGRGRVGHRTGIQCGGRGGRIPHEFADRVHHALQGCAVTGLRSGTLARAAIELVGGGTRVGRIGRVS